MAKSFTGKIAVDIRASEPDWGPYLAPKAPDGAPNVLVLAWDDLGYATMDTFGGPVECPNMARIAARGVKFANFHTTALCSPTRASFLTGRNATSKVWLRSPSSHQGFRGSRPDPLRERVHLRGAGRAGYNTYCVGKWHLTPGEECNLAAYKGRWPLGRGFERFYGWLGGETNSYFPDLVHDNHPVEPPGRPEDGYHMADDMAERAVEFIRDAKVIDPDKPFFMYLAPRQDMPRIWSPWNGRTATRASSMRVMRPSGPASSSARSSGTVARGYRAVRHQPARRAGAHRS